MTNNTKQEKDQFKTNCKKLGIPTKTISTKITVDVYNELETMRKQYPISMEQLLRDMIDYMIQEKGE